MENTVLLPVEGKKKFKFRGLTAEQVKILNEHRGNIFKALTAIGGAYLAYETYKSVINISEEEWRNLLPDELEKLLAPFLQENIDIEECLPEPEVTIYETEAPEIINQDTDPRDNKVEPSQNIDYSGKAEDALEDLDIDKEIIAEITADEKHTVIDKEMEDYINSDEFISDLNDDSATEVIINDDYVEDAESLIFEEESDTEHILDEKGIDENLIEDVLIPSEEPEIDEEMMNYINSGDILIDLNDDSAEEVIINNEYIDSDEEIFIDDYSDYESLENDSDLFEEEWDDDEDFEDIDLNDIPDNI